MHRNNLSRIVIAVDPAVTSHASSNFTGIVVAGKDRQNRAFILDDLSCQLSPDQWARQVIKAYHMWQADRVVAEENQGGAMVEQILRTVDPTVSYKAVRAWRGKKLRAEPVAALYEQGRVFHVGCFPDLEDEMCHFTGDPTDKDDRLDALVWAVTELLLSEPERVTGTARLSGF